MSEEKDVHKHSLKTAAATEREIVLLIKDAFKGIKWARSGAGGLHDRDYISRRSKDIDICIDSKIRYHKIVERLQKHFPEVPVSYRDKNFRKTLRRKIIILNYEGMRIDIQFGEYGLKEDEEINELVGISTGVLTPYLSPADIAYRKLMRWAKFDADDVQEMIKNGVIDIAELKRKIEESNELESQKNRMKARLEEK